MVVLVIIAILVAVAIPLYNGTQATARERACRANIRIIDGAIAQYYAEHGKYPDEVAGAGNSAVELLVSEGFLQEEPDCPHDGIGEANPDDYVVTAAHRAACTVVGCPNNK